MRKLLIAALTVAAALSQAQVFEPVRNISDTANKRNSVVFQFSRYDWDVPGVSGNTGGLLAVDFALGDEFGVGFWFASDRQSDGFVTLDMTWTEFHFNWFFVQQEHSTPGLVSGALRIDDGTDWLQWSEFGLVGSSTLDPNAPDGSKWTLGYNLARVAGQSSSLFGVPRNGWTYGLNLAFRFDESWSMNTSWYVLDFTSDGGGTITRSGLGVGFRF